MNNCYAQAIVVCLHCANIDMNFTCVILYCKVIIDIFIILHFSLIFMLYTLLHV